MPTVTVNGQTFSDGVYSGICSREKAKRDFIGIVSLTEGGRVIATGPCVQCGNPITRVLYTP